MSEVERLRECLRLAEVATAGEWQSHGPRVFVGQHMVGVCNHIDTSNQWADAEIIAAAVNWLRNDAPALLARLEALVSEWSHRNAEHEAEVTRAIFIENRNCHIMQATVYKQCADELKVTLAGGRH